MRWIRTRSLAGFASINALWISLTVQDTALMTIAVPSALLKLAPGDHIRALAVLAGTANCAAMLVPPLAGWLSDRDRQRGGTRRGWVFAGIAIDVAALVALAFAKNLLLFGALFVLTVAAANVAIAAYQAMIPEVIPRASWGAASGMRGAATLIGTVAGLGLAGIISDTSIVFFATAATLVLGALSLLDVAEGDAYRPEHTHVTRWHDFIVMFIARSFVFFGLALLMTFVLYFFRDVLHAANPGAGTASIGIFSLLGAIASSVVFGIVSDRVPRKYLVAACGIPMALAAGGFAVAPNPSAIFAFAALFGVGLGGLISVGWALAIDSLPKLSDVARDLGIWGIATNLPAVVAPVAGGWILASFGGARAGYQAIFALAGVSFAIGSLTILRVGARPISSLAAVPVWLAACACNSAYLHVVYRIRGWGRLARGRGSTVIVVNHQHDLEAMALVGRMGLQSSWRHPIFTSTGRRMWEPGFFSVRFPWMRAIWRRVTPAPLFRALGFMPIENELATRTLASFAWDVQSLHGPLPLAAVFTPAVAARFPGGTTTNQLWRSASFATAQEQVRLREVLPPYRDELIRLTRERIERDLTAIEDVVRRGATFFATAEGRYTPTGEILPMRALLRRLLPLAESLYVAGTSYDLFRGPRFSLLYRVRRVRDRSRLVEELAAARPVTVTQLLAAWLVDIDGSFTDENARDAVRAGLAAVPSALFVDPEVRRDPGGCVRTSIATMLRDGLLVREADGRLRIGKRTHWRFIYVDDVFAYHARFYAQSVAAVTTRSDATLIPSSVQP